MLAAAWRRRLASHSLPSWLGQSLVYILSDDLRHATSPVKVATMRLMWCCTAIGRWPVMRKLNHCALAAAILLSAFMSVAAAASSSFADQLEMLEWSDPERAIQIVDAAPPVSADSASEIDMLEIRGMIYADSS